MLLQHHIRDGEDGLATGDAGDRLGLIVIPQPKERNGGINGRKQGVILTVQRDEVL
jgi:hypothetical protein